jgi:hypothetical protein
MHREKANIASSRVEAAAEPAVVVVVDRVVVPTAATPGPGEPPHADASSDSPASAGTTSSTRAGMPR